ncbi:major tail protein [Streptomyces phage Ididsumtinwong]|uniref:Major tail protein n=3 Tax=Austintatiousvirus TaxID=2733169 RepID=A0A411AXH8_9CAUD|nr:major tail protein [Streptomyces phage Ididsumtinwong]YP_009819785.1 major tail protein [Streptomyces phage Austintatious]APD18490.1 major tail protein [Streptomyces phage Ididsumtinwong]APD18711.1 major tail protein [Streptomyces phage Bioscum]QAX92775.1 major tail protein [Streptomyces phage Austintatious]
MAGNSRSIDARGWLFEVEDADAGTETWLPIAGLNSWSYSPGENEEVADTTSFDSDGAYEEDVMQRGASITLEGQYRIDKTTKARDVGQAYIDEDWTPRLGIDSHNRIRYRHETQTAWAIWDATMTPGEQSGGTNEKTSWSATFRRSGLPTSAAVTP